MAVVNGVAALGRLCVEWVYAFRGWVVAAVVLPVLLLEPVVQGGTVWAGFSIAMLGVVLRIWCRMYLGKHSRTNTIQAPHLVTQGPYAYSRNPLYLSNIFTISGIIISRFGAVGFLWFPILGALYTVLALQEKSYLAGVFGKQYARWQKETPFWIPTGLSYPNPGQNQGPMEDQNITPKQSIAQSILQDVWTWVWLCAGVIVLWVWV
jgi:protein-S-isoprenylcysteine O-methyltransferase Ste14